MRRSALKERLLRALRSEISAAAPPTHNSPPTHFDSFSILPRPGQRWVRLLRSDHREHIQIDAIMVDGHASQTLSSSDSTSDVSAPRLHISLAVEVSWKASKDSDDTSVMQFLCSAWPDALDVDRVFAAPRPIPAIKPYLGPPFKDLDDEMKKAVHDYLEQRGINDDLAAFLHDYIAHKDQAEHIRWLQNIQSYVAK